EIQMSLTTFFTIRENVLIIRLTGELDHHEATILREAWQNKLREGTVKHVILNLEEVSFMDSSGIGVLLGRYKEILELGGELVVCSVSPAIKRILEMSGMFKIVRLESNEEFALLNLFCHASQKIVAS